MLTNSTTSIFNSKPNLNYKLWKKPTKEETAIILSQNLLFKGKMGKKSKNAQNTLKERMFYLTKNYFYYCKKADSKKISGFMILDWTRIFFSENQEISNSDFSSKISLVNFSRFTDLYLKDESMVEKWSEQFSQANVVFTDFQDRFKIIDIIAKGSFAKVNF